MVKHFQVLVAQGADLEVWFLGGKKIMLWEMIYTKDVIEGGHMCILVS